MKVEKVLNIGYVDDDVVFQILIKRLTKHFQSVNRIFQFYNGIDALDFLQKNRENPDLLPNILFVDINMPIMDGWEFIDEFIKIERDNPIPIKIFVCSSSESNKDMNKFKEYERLERYIVKPLTKLAMENILNELTNS
jgi:CheY-like chemotaxis protein